MTMLGGPGVGGAPPTPAPKKVNWWARVRITIAVVTIIILTLGIAGGGIAAGGRVVHVVAQDLQ